MNITNKNIKSTFLFIFYSLLFIAILDLSLSTVNGSLGNIFSGYSILVLPVLLCILYGYLGMPLFTLDGEAELWQLKSHFVLNKYVGKELYIIKSNIIDINIDRSGLRKKLIVRFLKDGEEVEEKFGISLLSEAKISKIINLKKEVLPNFKQPSVRQLFV